MNVTVENQKIMNIKFSDDNKFHTLNDYILQCDKGEFEAANVKVVKALHFNKIAAYNEFANNLLTDCKELEGLGDKNEAAAIYLNEELKFIVVTEGYSYARYVGII